MPVTVLPDDFNLNAFKREVSPYSFPFFFVDRVLEYEAGNYLIGVKNVSFNEPWTQGHFEQYPIFPGVLLIETAAQMMGVLAILTKFGDFENLIDSPSSQEFKQGLNVRLSKIDNVKFKKPILPGDQVKIRAEYESESRGFIFFSFTASVSDKQVASGGGVLSV